MILFLSRNSLLEISIMGHAGSYRCVTLLCPLSNRDGTWAPWLDLIKIADPTTTSSLAMGIIWGLCSINRGMGANAF